MIAGYGENGRPIEEAFVIGIAGKFISPVLNRQVNVSLVRSHNEIEFRRWLRERKGTSAPVSMNARIQPFTSSDPRRASNRSEPGVYSHRHHLISSPFPRQVRVPSPDAHVAPSDRIASTRNIPQKSSNWLSRVYMISTTLIQSTFRCSQPYG